MQHLRVTLSGSALLIAAILTLSCGAGEPRQQILSVTLSPAIADAHDYPGGKVQFTATGTYANPANMVTPLSATWGTCYQFAATTDVSISNTGLAQCTAGASGTYNIWANVPLSIGNASCPAEGACGGGCTVQGNALLTCP